MFEFILTVYDANNRYRNACKYTKKLAISTKNNNTNNEKHDEKLLMIQITPIKNEININDRLRLLASIINYKQSELLIEGDLYYEWIELNGLLNDTEIKEYKQSSDENYINLILKENALRTGQTYTF